jgi:thioredoxin-dependent peroxiredoxin
MALKAGDKAPDFKVKDQDGKEVKLSDFKGKKVVLYFYPKDMTPGCTAEACSLRDNYNYLIKAGYVVLGVSSDNEKMHQKFIQKEKLPFQLLADTDKVIHHLYGTWVEKSMYGRKYMGTARVTFIIDEQGKIEEVIEKVDTKNHADQILKTAPARSASPEKTAPKKSTAATKALVKPTAKLAKKAVKKATKKK